VEDASRVRQRPPAHCRVEEAAGEVEVGAGQGVAEDAVREGRRADDAWIPAAQSRTSAGGVEVAGARWGRRRAQVAGEASENEDKDK
jgi:hypothetical protein